MPNDQNWPQVDWWQFVAAPSGPPSAWWGGMWGWVDHQTFAHMQNQNQQWQPSDGGKANWFTPEQMMKMSWANNKLFNMQQGGQPNQWQPQDQWQANNAPMPWAPAGETPPVVPGEPEQQFSQEEFAGIVAQKLFEMQQAAGATTNAAPLSWSENFVRENFSNPESLPFFNAVKNLTPVKLAEVIDSWKASGMLPEGIEDVTWEDVIYRAQRTKLDPNTGLPLTQGWQVKIGHYGEALRALEWYREWNQNTAWQNQPADYNQNIQPQDQWGQVVNDSTAPKSEPRKEDSTVAEQLRTIVATQASEMQMKDITIANLQKKLADGLQTQEKVNSYEQRIGNDLFEVKSTPLASVIQNVSSFERTQDPQSKIQVLNSLKMFLQSIWETSWDIDGIIHKLTTGQSYVPQNQVPQQVPQNSGLDDTLRRLKGQSIK